MYKLIQIQYWQNRQKKMRWFNSSALNQVNHIKIILNRKCVSHERIYIRKPIIQSKFRGFFPKLKCYNSIRGLFWFLLGFVVFVWGFFSKFALFLKVTFPSLHVQDKEKSLVTFWSEVWSLLKPYPVLNEVHLSFQNAASVTETQKPAKRI